MKRVVAAALLAGPLAAPPALAAPPQQTRVVREAAPAPAPSQTALPRIVPPATERAARARANLEALRLGNRSVGDLTPQEMQDVIDLDRMLRGEAPDNRTFVEQCVDREKSRLGRRPSRLDMEVIKLKCR